MSVVRRSAFSIAKRHAVESAALTRGVNGTDGPLYRGAPMLLRRGRAVRSYIRSSLWVVPFIAIVLELGVAQVVRFADQSIGWKLTDLTAQGAQTLLQTIITMTMSFVVFTFGSLLVAIQVASGQLTPRIIATTLLRDRVVRYSVGLFVFTLLFAVGALNRTGTEVHQLTVFVAAGLGLLSMATFLYLIDYAAKLLRPISILERVAEDGLAVIEQVYPERAKGPDVRIPPRNLGNPGRIVTHRGTSRIVLGLDLDILLLWARKTNGVIEFKPAVGDFVGRNEPLFGLYGKTAALEDQQLRAAVSFGPERTLEQDPTFAFRIVIDIALKALSPAINDPTTAVLAIDQLQRLLRTVGTRYLRSDEILDDAGVLRVIVRTPNWEDFVHLAFSEIRRAGAGQLQTARRLRAMIENLMQTLPAHRCSALREQLNLLDRDIERAYSFAEDLALARSPDLQGLGGARL